MTKLTQISQFKDLSKSLLSSVIVKKKINKQTNNDSSFFSQGFLCLSNQLVPAIPAIQISWVLHRRRELRRYRNLSLLQIDHEIPIPLYNSLFIFFFFFFLRPLRSATFRAHFRREQESLKEKPHKLQRLHGNSSHPQ